MFKNFFNQQSFQEPVDFFPELNLYNTANTKDDSAYLSLRFFSGDEKNNNKNLKIKSENIQEITLKIDGFDEQEIPSGQHAHRFIEGESFLMVKRFDQEQAESYLLSKHRIKISPVASGKKGDVWMETAQIKQEIIAIIQDEFGAALEEYENEASGKTASSSTRASGVSAKPTFTVYNLIIALCILITLGALGSIAKKMYINSGPAPASQNIFDAAANAPVIQQAQNGVIDTDAEALAEFGLEKGINLEK